MARKQKEMARAEQAIARKPQELARTEQDNARAKRFQGERETTGGAENVRAGARVSSPGVRGQGGAEEVSMEEAVDGGEEGGRTREPVVPGAFEDKEAVLLDVRNVYETSIGHFRFASGLLVLIYAAHHRDECFVMLRTPISTLS